MGMKHGPNDNQWKVGLTTIPVHAGDLPSTAATSLFATNSTTINPCQEITSLVCDISCRL